MYKFPVQRNCQQSRRLLYLKRIMKGITEGKVFLFFSAIDMGNCISITSICLTRTYLEKSLLVRYDWIQKNYNILRLCFKILYIKINDSVIFFFLIWQKLIMVNPKSHKQVRCCLVLPRSFVYVTDCMDGWLI